MAGFASDSESKNSSFVSNPGFYPHICQKPPNLLDNAIEACAKEESPTQIMMLIKKTHGYYRIVVKNTIRESVLQKNRELKSDKENKALHGWGLRSVAEIAERHLGGLDIYEKNGMFVVSVLLANDEFGNLGTKEETVGAK